MTLKNSLDATHCSTDGFTETFTTEMKRVSENITQIYLMWKNIYSQTTS